MTMMTPPKISLAAARINADYQQKEAAAALGVSPLTLARWERGETVPNYEMVQKIVDLYHYPADYIFFGRR